MQKRRVLSCILFDMLIIRFSLMQILMLRKGVSMRSVRFALEYTPRADIME